MKVEEMRLVIAQAIKKSGTDQRELGLKLGVNDRTIRKWLGGRCKLDQYISMCEAVGLSVEVRGPETEMVVRGHFTVTNKTGNI